MVQELKQMHAEIPPEDERGEGRVWNLSVGDLKEVRDFSLMI